MTLDQIRIKEDDKVCFKTKTGQEHCGVVIDADDPAKIRLKIDTGREVYVGRAAVKRAAETHLWSGTVYCSTDTTG